MAPKDTSDQVSVVPKRLRQSADLFDGWSQDMGSAADAVAGLTITAGTFPAAGKLKETVETRAKQLNTNATKLGAGLGKIATNLRDIATQYGDTENKNKDSANRIKPMLDGVNEALDEPAKD